MRKYLPILLLSLLLGSCYKYITIDNNIHYIMQGIGNITIDQNDSVRMYVTCELQSGDPTNEYVAMKVSGVPDNVAINTDSITFRPNYSIPLAFYAHNPKPGVYPITVTTTSSTVGTKQYTFNLTVTSLTDCTAEFSAIPEYAPAGSQHHVQVAGGTGPYYAYISRIGCDTLRIDVVIDSTIPALGGAEPYEWAKFQAVVNCSANTITIYPQSASEFSPVNNAMIRGAGTYVPVTDTSATATLYDTVYVGSQIVSTDVITIY